MSEVSAPGVDTYDDLAGVVDLFGALTRDELTSALQELAFKRGHEAEASDFTGAVEDAVEGYVLVTYDASNPSDADATELLVPGPVAFPAPPPGTEDLPHIMDVPGRTVDRDALARQVEARFRTDAARAVQADDESRIAELLDVSYDLEAWGPVDAATVRERLDAVLDELDDSDEPDE